MSTHRFRFRPRHRGVAGVTLGVGGALTTSGLVWVGLVASFPLVVGLAGIALGTAYLASPTWRYVVEVDDTSLAVVSGTRDKFRLAWTEVVHVLASPSTKTCFVDAGDPARNLLVPGDGAPAPYAIEDRGALYDFIVGHVDAAKISEIDTIEAELRRTAPPPPPKRPKRPRS